MQILALTCDPFFGCGQIHPTETAVGNSEQGFALAIFLGRALLIGHLIAVVSALHAAVDADILVIQVDVGYIITLYWVVDDLIIYVLLFVILNLMACAADGKLLDVNIICVHTVRQIDEAPPHAVFQRVGQRLTVAAFDSFVLCIQDCTFFVCDFLFRIHAKGHGLAVLRIAVVQPFLAHHDAVALAGRVDDNGGIIAGCIIALGGVGREIGIILAVLEQDVFIQRAALVILRQALNDGVPVFVF